MSLHVPLPRTVEDMVQQTRDGIHPGLLLDKFVQCVGDDFLVPGEKRGKKWTEAVHSPTLQRVVEAAKHWTLLPQVVECRRRLLEATKARVFSAQNTTPLTLHLSRASALENAGICLHRIYGFAYLPGSGLKGMARAYAETVWFPAQFERNAEGKPRDEVQLQNAVRAWEKIEQVFGWSPGSDRDKCWKPRYVSGSQAEKARKTKTPASAGAVVFHDAWPVQPAPLVRDIVNNHHSKYYQSRGGLPPGDWEDPVPVYFLAVPPGQEFQFALSLRRGRRAEEQGRELLDRAAQWLIGALTYAGAGAKTNAGYGKFCLKEPPQNVVASVQERETATFTVELATPAFLAGAEQGEEDCDLRGATLRGLLRWWWRTMHAGFLSSEELYELESAIWGDTQQSGAVRVVVEPVPDTKKCDPVAFKKIGKRKGDGKEVLQPEETFFRKHKISISQTTTQPLHYLAYGMDEMKTGQRRTRRQRYVCEAGARWKITLTARKLKIKRRAVPAAIVLEQATSALCLLCTFGGVGSKSRKGFGSLQIEWGKEVADCNDILDQCRNAAQQFRKLLGYSRTFNENQVQSSALGEDNNHIALASVKLTETDSWRVMHFVGEAYQHVAGVEYKHKVDKACLGLPRQIHGPLDKPIRNRQSYETWQPPRKLKSRKGDRYASPLHIHVAKIGDDYVVRLLAFRPPRDLFDIEKDDPERIHNDCTEFLEHFVDKVVNTIISLLRKDNEYGPPVAQSRNIGTPEPPKKKANTLVKGQIVTVRLLEKDRKNRWVAEETQTNRRGKIKNSGRCPADWTPGMEVQVTIDSIEANQLWFKYTL